MTEEQIKKDRQDRVVKAKDEIQSTLKKYELELVAEDMIGEHTKIEVMLQFQDRKKYPTAKLAQEDHKILTDMLEGEGDPIPLPKENDRK